MPKAEDEPSAAERGLREVIAGHPRGAVRRILLYLVVIVAMALMLGNATDAERAAYIVASVALLLLAATDQIA